MLATVLKPPDALDAQALIPSQPLVNGIGVTRLQQAVTGDGMGRLAIGNFQQGSTAFTDKGAQVMIAMVL
jgi:hypothetical protein